MFVVLSKLIFLVNSFGVPDHSSTLIHIVVQTTLKLSFLSQEKQRFFITTGKFSL